MAVKQGSVRAPAELLQRVKTEADKIWGTHDQVSEATKAALRDWVARRNDPMQESRLRQLEERLLSLERRPSSPVPSGGEMIEERPSVLHPRIQAELDALKRPICLDELVAYQWEPAPTPDRSYQRRITERLKKGEYFGLVAPEALLGFRTGAPVDVGPYHELGFPPARTSERYTLSDPTFMAYVEQFCVASHFPPIMIYLYSGRLLVVDGLARLSAVALFRRFYPRSFTTVPYVFMPAGNTECGARRLMITLNLNNGPRALTWEETDAALKRLKN